MGVLWLKAPLLLRRHPPVLAAIVLAVALAALAAASVPLMRAGVESESLAGQLRTLTPLATGLEVQVFGGTARDDARRRAAAARLGQSLPFVGPLVASSKLDGLQVSGTAAPGLEVVALARTNASAHVRRVTGGDPAGVWIADTAAHSTHLRPGDVLRLTMHVSSGTFPIVSMRIAGIYHSLEGDRDNPYWSNWLQDIRNLGPDPEPPPTFVLMNERTFQRVARRLLPVVENRFEFPVAPHGLSYADAVRLDDRFATLGEELVRPASQIGRAIDCRPQNCRTSSSLSAALTVAATEVGSVSPTVSLLSGIGIAIALGLCVAAGLFLVRRRADEAHVLFTRGESTAAFAARTALEALLPAVVAGAAGLGSALLVLHALAPAGTVTRATTEAGAGRAALATLAALAGISLGAAVAFPRRAGGERQGWRRVAHVPWEVVPLAAAAGALSLVVTGHGVAHDPSGATHPRLAVFLVPVLAVAGAGGLTVRGARRLLAGRGGGAAPAVFLALRRIGAARGLFVAVVVATATAFGTFAYASTLSSSLGRSVAEKAFVSNGSDVQGLIDPSVRLTRPFAFPVALAQIDQLNVSYVDGTRVDLIAGDPDELERTLLWRSGWSDDPRRLLPRLASYRGPGLAAIATPGAPHADAIVDQGVRIPVHVVGHAPVPGATAGRPALLVSWPALRVVARRVHIFDPAPQSTGVLWAKGDPHALEPVLDASDLAPAYLTTLDHIRKNASVSAADRSYRYVRLIGAAAAVLALVALLLYLQARQRAQLIASALVRRMGLGRAADAAALGLEAGGIVLLAGVAGSLVAVAAAVPITHRVDSLPQYAPAPVLTLPWTAVGVGLAAAVVAGAVLGAAAAAIAGRADAGEALRVV